MRSVISVFLFVLACNLDTLILSYTWALRGAALCAGPALAVAAITSAITGLSLGLGTLAGELLNGAAGRLGALVLLAMGLWTVLDWLRCPQGQEEPPCMGCVPLAAALAVNNAGIGAAAGVSGLSPLWCAGANFFVTLLLLRAGRVLARRTADSLLGRYAVPLSGVLLAALGLAQVLDH